MSLLLLLKPHGAAVSAPPAVDLPLPSTGNTARHAVIPPPRRERFLAGTAAIWLRATQPNLLLVPTAKGGTVRLAGKSPDWEMLLESQAKKTQIVYRAVKDERVDDDFHDAVLAAFLLTR